MKYANNLVVAEAATEARNTITDLVDEIGRLRAENTLLKEKLEDQNKVRSVRKRARELWRGAKHKVYNW